MASVLAAPWDERLLRYDFGPDHPLAPVRLALTWSLAQHLGVLDRPGVRVAAAPLASDDALLLGHSAEYVDAVRRAERSDPLELLDFGVGGPDTPAFPGMHQAAARIVGASLVAAEQVWSGAVSHAVSVAGGLHHAMRAHAAGFCVYNDAVIAIARLLELGAARVAYIDMDAHHGDGVQAAFLADPRVLTISLHEHPRFLFPGTGYPTEVGVAPADGLSVNVALPPGTGDAAWLRAFDAVVPPLLAEFRPEVIVSQHGCDSHRLDPLADLRLTVDGQLAGVRAAHELAHQHAAGRWLALGGGGYEVVDVVPRIWTHLLAEAAHAPIEPETETPAGWRREVARRTGRQAPVTMSDGPLPPVRRWSGGYDPADRVDQAILATCRAVFPHHGILSHY